MLKTKIAEHKKLLVLIGIILCTFLGMFLFFKLTYFIAPFLIAFIVSMMMEPVVKLLTQRAKLPRNVASAITLFIFVLILGSILTLIVFKMIAEIKAIYVILPDLFTGIYEDVSVLIEKADQYIKWLPDDVTSKISEMLNSLSGSLAKLISPMLQGAYVTVKSIPESVIFILITIISTFFLSSDKHKITNLFKTQLPESFVNKSISIKNDMFLALFGYIKAQLILMSVTFTELFIGLTIIQVKYSLLLAFLIALVDALPILGTGGILIPWAIYSAITGNLGMGISLFILYVIVLVVRQMIEPKVLGQQIGVHPLLTLLSMYIGLKVLGVAGLILGPITTLLLKNILSGILGKRTLKEYFSNSKQ